MAEKITIIEIAVTEAQESHKNKQEELDFINTEVAELQYGGAKNDIKKLSSALFLEEKLLKDAKSALEAKDVDKAEATLSKLESQVEKPWKNIADVIYKKLDSAKHALEETKNIETAVKEGEIAIKKDIVEQKITAEQGKVCLDYVKRLKSQIAKLRKAIDAGRVEETQKLLEELKALWERAKERCPSIASSSQNLQSSGLDQQGQ